jgi:hypothetical protein
LTLCACPDKAAQSTEQDRLLAKLKAEQDRIKREGEGPTEAQRAAAILNGQEDPLAKTAAEAPRQVKELKLPAKIDFPAGKLTVRLNALETSQTAAGERMKLSTNEQFLRIDLKLKATETAEFDFNAATLHAGEEVFPIARDVQRLVGTKNLAGTIEAGGALETALMFELPDAAIAKGVTLKLPLAPPLEVPLQ